MAHDTARGPVRLRSQLWFDNPGRPGHDRAVHRAVPELGADAGGAPVGQAAHRHRPVGLGPGALQPVAPGVGEARARGHPGGRRHRVRVPGPPHPGDRQAADGQPGPESRLPGPGRDAVRLPHRRGGADHRLRQDHALPADGRSHRQHPGHRAVGRTDAQRLVQGRAHRLRHHQVARQEAQVRGQDRLDASTSTWSRRPRPHPGSATRWAPRPR